MATANTGSIDLESVLNVRRRTLASIGELRASRHQPQVTDTIYLKREDDSNSILSIDSKIFLFGELQLLYAIFERYTSNIVIYEESNAPSSPISSHQPTFSATAEEEEHEEHNEQGLPIVSTLRKASLSSSKGSGSPPQISGSPPQISGSPSQMSGSPPRRKPLSSQGRSQTIGSSISEYSVQSLEGKRYGCIQLPNMTIIETLEILLRSGLELVDVSSDYNQNVLHQNFVLSKIRTSSQKYGSTLSKSTSVTGT